MWPILSPKHTISQAVNNALRYIFLEVVKFEPNTRILAENSKMENCKRLGRISRKIQETSHCQSEDGRHWYQHSKIHNIGTGNTQIWAKIGVTDDRATYTSVKTTRTHNMAEKQDSVEVHWKVRSQKIDYHWNLNSVRNGQESWCFVNYNVPRSCLYLPNLPCSSSRMI